MMIGRNLCWAAGAAIIAICVLQVSGNERVLNCRVTRTPAGVTNMIVEAQELNDKCMFSWNNCSGFVMSSHKNPSGKGLNSSVRSLNTSQCFECIVFKGTCLIGGFGTDFKADCTTNCSAETALHQGTDGSTLYWLIIVPLAVAFMLIMLICQLIKKKGCGPKTVYTFLRKNDENPKPLDVEVGNE